MGAVNISNISLLYCEQMIVWNSIYPPLASLLCVSIAQYAREVNGGRNDRQRPPAAPCINQATPTLVFHKVTLILIQVYYTCVLCKRSLARSPPMRERVCVCYTCVSHKISTHLLQKVSLLGWLVGGILLLPSAQNHLRGGANPSRASGQTSHPLMLIG